MLAVLQTASLTAATVYTRASGNWTSTSVWSYTDGGASCGCTPTGADVVYIRHVVNLNKHLTNGSGTLGAVTGSLNILPEVSSVAASLMIWMYAPVDRCMSVDGC